MAETTHHYRVDPPESRWELIGEEEIDWDLVDRLLILMSLGVTERILRKVKRTHMDSTIRIKVLERLTILIEEYKKPP